MLAVQNENEFKYKIEKISLCSIGSVCINFIKKNNKNSNRYIKYLGFKSCNFLIDQIKRIFFSVKIINFYKYYYEIIIYLFIYTIL